MNVVPLVVSSALTLFSSTATAQRPEIKRDRALAIELRDVAFPKFTIRLNNLSDNEGRIWDFGNTWGDKQVKLQIAATGFETFDVVRNFGTYSANVPSFRVIKPRGHTEYKIDLSDKSWVSPNDPPPRPKYDSLSVTLTVPKISEATDNNVIVGSWK